MTRLALLQALCDLYDALDRLARDVQPARAQSALEALAHRVDTLVDGCVRGGMPGLDEADPSPCPHCGLAHCLLAYQPLDPDPDPGQARDPAGPQETLTRDLDPDVPREDTP